MKKGQFIDLTGQRFGRLTVIERTGEQGSRSMWLCRCDCGNLSTVSVSNLRNGHTQSCGCLVPERTSQVMTKHGGKGKEKTDRLYPVWRSMKQRCLSPKNRAFKWYGALGVTVCEEWSKSYKAFRDWALANGYDENADRAKCTLDRIDCFGNYEPSNCRWVDMKVQARNKRKALAR